jgi:hypothetical protein
MRIKQLPVFPIKSKRSADYNLGQPLDAVLREPGRELGVCPHPGKIRNELS